MKVVDDLLEGFEHSHCQLNSFTHFFACFWVVRAIVDVFTLPQLVVGESIDPVSASENITFQSLTNEPSIPRNKRLRRILTDLYFKTISLLCSSSLLEQSRFRGFVTVKKCFARPQYVA